MTYSRRRLLVTATALAAGTIAGAPLAGCGLLDREPEPPDPLDPLLAATVALAARYDAAIAAAPQLAERLTGIRDAHRAHARALAQLIGRPASSLSPNPSATAAAPADVAATVAELRTAEQSGREAAAAACLAAPADRAALLGSITAARATHLEVLDD